MTTQARSLPQHALPYRWYPAHEHESEVGWAHVSGWAQLNLERRSVSCVIAVRNELAALRALLPELSDVLTECGYPWEIIVVDRASRDGTEQVFRAWCELPGYRLIALDDALDRSSAIVLGLEAARGDAVILLDPELTHSLSALPEMVMRWEGGSPVLYASQDPYSGDNVVRVPRAASGAARATPPRQQGDSTGLVLLDRSAVRELMR